MASSIASDRPVERTVRPPVSLPFAFAVVVAMRLSLKVAGFGKSIALVRFLVRSSKRHGQGGMTEARLVVDRVAAAGAIFPGRARCLEQALAAYCLLRWIGMDVVFRIGAQPYGFIAHAWVELNGEPINDNEVARKVAPFPPIL